MIPTENPLQGGPPEEVPLVDAPLVLVIAQVRFPLLTSIESRDFVAPFQEAIRSEYPVLRPEQVRGFVFGPTGVKESRSTTTWRFSDVDGAWKVTLASDFLAIETSAYSSRVDFLNRFESVLHALVTFIDPKVVDRLGVRYIDRVVGNDLDQLPQWVRPEVCGILGTPLASAARHALCESVFELRDEQAEVLARWGLLPPKATVDPAAIEPAETASWLLDLDVYRVQTRRLDVAEVVQQARAYAERIYTIFRWAVTPEFLRRYGGRL